MSEPTIAKYYLHPFEEPCISFSKGSGTIFFTGCNLKCVFCQNYELSRAQRGKKVSPKELAQIFQELEAQGADNISLVTAGHLVPYLIEAFEIYRPKIPVVYNSSGYEKVSSLQALDKYIDIYLPDLKFYSPLLSGRYTGREDYFEVASKALLFMAKKPFSQTEEGKLLSGIIVRHLVMPLGVNDSKSILKWLKTHMPETAKISLMSQYIPYGDSGKYPELQRRVTKREYESVLNEAIALGFGDRLYAQERASSQEKYIPSWDF